MNDFHDGMIDVNKGQFFRKRSYSLTKSVMNQNVKTAIRQVVYRHYIYIYRHYIYIYSSSRGVVATRQA